MGEPDEKASTNPAINFELLHFRLRFDHEQGVIEQEYHQISTVALPSAALIQRALVNHLPTFFLEPKVLMEAVSAR